MRDTIPWLVCGVLWFVLPCTMCCPDLQYPLANALAYALARYMFGGEGFTTGFSGAARTMLSDAWVLETATNTPPTPPMWRQLMDMGSARHSAVAGVLTMIDADLQAQAVIAVVGGRNSAGESTADVLLCVPWDDVG